MQTSTALPSSRLAKPFAARLGDIQWGWLILALHLLVWTAAPLLVSRNLPMDALEALAWGREWQWGYYKHPPLSGWLAELARFGAHDWSIYLLAQCMVTSAMAATWLLGRDVLGPRLALYALMATEGVHYFNMSSTEFNANVVMFPFWAWTSLSFWRAMRTGRPAWWLAMGLCCGLGFLGKYVFGLLPASMLLFTLVHRDARRCWRTAGPWLALLVFALLAAPHLQWAIANDWPTLHYALARGQGEEAARDQSWPMAFVSFVVAQGLTLLPMWALLRALGWHRASAGVGMAAGDGALSSRDRWLLFTLALGPALLIMSVATVAQAHMLDMWASPFFLMAAPAYMALSRKAPRTGSASPLREDRFMHAWLAWMMVCLSLYAGAALLGPQRKHKLDRTSYPGKCIATELARQWQGDTHAPLRIVAGEEFVAETVAHYAADGARERPSVFYDADFSESMWLTPEQVRRDGALFVWPVSRGEATTIEADSRKEVAALKARYPRLEVRPTLRRQTTWMGRTYEVAVAWAVLPPEGSR